MTDRDERGKDVTNRMSQRFENDETGEQSEPSKPSEPEQPDDPTESDEPDEPDEATESDDTEEEDETSVKDERVGTYMYLPESQKDEMKRQYNYLKADYEIEYDGEFEKNRHFYPLVAEYGLDSLEELSPSDVRDRLENNGWL